MTALADRRAHAEALRSLYRPGDPVVLVNVWDAASARVVAAAPGCRAIATASWSIAAAHGYADGERMPLELMLAAVERVAAAVDLPVSADLESGYGDRPEQVAETVARAIAAGAVGGNLEDRLRPAAEHARIVEAVRARAEREGVPFVINARSDEFLLGERRLEEAIARAAAYAEAGADCFFVPGLHDLAAIRRLVHEVALPVSVLPTAGSPSLADLAAAGVARISLGPGPMGVAYAALRRASEALLAGGDYPADLGFRPPVPG